MRHVHVCNAYLLKFKLFQTYQDGRLEVKSTDVPRMAYQLVILWHRNMYMYNSPCVRRTDTLTAGLPSRASASLPHQGLHSNSGDDQPTCGLCYCNTSLMRKLMKFADIPLTVPDCLFWLRSPCNFFTWCPYYNVPSTSQRCVKVLLAYSHSACLFFHDIMSPNLNSK